MKAITNTSESSSTCTFGSSAKITKHKRDVENEEIRAYLSKLKELVPFMPKNRRLSKLEVIQYVIDYICDLQRALETHPTISSVAVHSAAAAAVMLSSASQAAAAAAAAAAVNLQMLGIATATATATATEHRQPLAILRPNATNIPNANTCSVSQSSSSISTTTGTTSNGSSSSSSTQNEKVAYSSQSCKSVAY